MERVSNTDIVLKHLATLAKHALVDPKIVHPAEAH